MSFSLQHEQFLVKPTKLKRSSFGQLTDENHVQQLENFITHHYKRVIDQTVSITKNISTHSHTHMVTRGNVS